MSELSLVILTIKIGILVCFATWLMILARLLFDAVRKGTK